MGVIGRVLLVGALLAVSAAVAPAAAGEESGPAVEAHNVAGESDWAEATTTPSS